MKRRHPSFIYWTVLVILATSLALPGLAWAEAVQIESDHLEIAQKKQEAVFSGSVKLNRGDFELRADKIIAHYNQTGLTQGLTSAKAQGNVTMRMGDRHGKSDQALMDHRQGIVKLIGHAVITQKGGRIQGGTIVYDMNKDTIKVLQGDSGRVRVHIESSDDLQKLSP